MTKTEFHFLSKDGKTKIHARRWMPDDGAVYGVVQLVHGMQEYIDRYDEFADFLTGHGLMVVGHDHLGHGSSVRSEKQLGYFCRKHPSDVLVEDMHQLTMITKNEYPNLPYVIFGHSMGSYLLRKYLSKYSENVDGAIICGTGSVPDASCLFGMAVCQVLAAFRGWHYRSEFVKNATFGKAYAMYDMDGTHPENSWISRNVESVKAYYADSRCNYRFTLNGYYGLFSTVRYDNQPRCLAGTRKELPIYIISGSEDSVGDHGAGVKRVYRQYKKAGFSNVTMKLYEGARHELINETNRAEVYEDIWSWIHREVF